MQRKCQKFILLSFDVEEFDIPLNYHQSIDINEQLYIGHQGLLQIGNLLDAHSNITSTFFTTACFANNFPGTICHLASNNEIASHTYYNSRFITSDLLLSKRVLESIIQKPVYGLRMPQMKEPPLSAVREAQYFYDASMNPTYLPGHYNNLKRPRSVFNEQGVVRIPASVSSHLRIPLFWLSLKLFPYQYYKYLALNALRKDGFLSLYFHPWEFTDIIPYNIPWYIKHPCNHGMLNLLNRLLKDLEKEADFITMHEFALMRSKYYEYSFS